MSSKGVAKAQVACLAMAVALCAGSAAQACRVGSCATRAFTFSKPPLDTPDDALVLKLKVISVSPGADPADAWWSGFTDRTATVVGVDQGWAPAAQVRIAGPDLIGYGDPPYPALGETAWMVGRMHRLADGSQMFMPYAMSLARGRKRYGGASQPLWMDPCDTVCEHRRLRRR